MGLLATALAAVHMGLAAWTKRARPAGQAITGLALGIAITLAILAIPIQFTAYRITMAWSLEFLALAWIAARTRNTLLRYAAILISGLVWMRLLMFDSWIYPDPASYTLVGTPRFFTFLLPAPFS